MDNTEYLKQLAETQKNTKRTELEQQRAEALRQSNLEKDKVLPTFETAKQQTNVQSKIGAKNLAEFWARRGQTNQGISAQAELSRQNVLGRDIGAINQQQGEAVQRFADQRTGIQNEFSSNLNNAYGQIDTGLQQNLYNERVRRQEVQDRKDAATLAYNRSKASTKSQILKGVLIPHDYAVQNQISGVKIDDKTMRYQVGNNFVDVPVGVNPFTGQPAKDAYITDPVTKKKTLSVFGNGYQPDNVSGNKLAKSGVTANINGQQQTVWKVPGTTTGAGLFDFKKKTTTPDKYYVWDGAANKYWSLTSQEKKDLGLK